MFSIFGGVAVVLAAVGLYGVMSFSVNQRTQEFGIRMALRRGPRPHPQDVLRQGAIQVALGLGLGLFLAWSSPFSGAAASRPSSFKRTQRSADLLLGGGVVELSFVLRHAGPARRASRVDAELM